MKLRTTAKLKRMRKVTKSTFFHSPRLLNTLGPGQTLIVTEKGATSFTVTKAGKRPVKTAEDLHREACKMFPGDRPKVNFTEIIKTLRK
jgi:hypothetical protein